MTYHWERELAAAIVLQAYKDFSAYARKYKRGENTEQCIAGMKEIVDFVNSDWFRELTDIPQDKFLNKLKEVSKK